MKSSATSSVVIDANIVVYAVWEGERTAAADALLNRLEVEEKILHVPALWRAEVVSVLHAIGALHGADREHVKAAVQAALGMGIKVVPLDDALCFAALEWADALRQTKAYDAFYLALADRLGCDFWTGDKRLYNRARQVGADFVRLLGESEA
ncbi:MAG TPA: PIN domain-containing protein [Chloroflexi bacterium]|nr:PIN domain-containing protein [Chloroflexota bacterium]